MYKVFYNDRTVFFTPTDQGIEDLPENQVHYFKNKKQLKNIISDFQDNQYITQLFIIHPDIEFVFNKFIKLYKLIEAAGGLVKNSSDQVLIIYRREKWDLPKGKLEKKETPEIGAIREVEEECGIDNLKIIKLIDKTYHTYKLGKKDILKRTYWFEMISNSTKKLIPQTEEEITEVKWFNKKDLVEVVQNTFPSIIEILKKGGYLLFRYHH